MVQMLDKVANIFCMDARGKGGGERFVFVCLLRVYQVFIMWSINFSEIDSSAD